MGPEAGSDLAVAAPGFAQESAVKMWPEDAVPEVGGDGFPVTPAGLAGRCPRGPSSPWRGSRLPPECVIPEREAEPVSLLAQPQNSKLSFLQHLLVTEVSWGGLQGQDYGT